MRGPESCSCGAGDVVVGQHTPRCDIFLEPCGYVSPMCESHRAERVLADVAVIGLVEHIADLHREIGDLGDQECPFVSAFTRKRSEGPDQ
jgi:hypothetical protein